MNRGVSTGYFDIKRGVRQGDPLSPYSSLLAIEILFNNKDYLCNGKKCIHFYEDLYMKNIYSVKQILEKDKKRPVTYFHNLGLGSVLIVKIWEICEDILKSGKYEKDTYDFFSVDLEEYSISLKIFENIILFKDIPSRKVYELFITNLQQSYTLPI